MLEKFVLRDVDPDELITRDGMEDVTDEHLETRELSQPEIEARSIPDGSPETVTRNAADDFIAALLQSRDSEVTPESLFGLASLASRALDDLE